MTDSEKLDKILEKLDALASKVDDIRGPLVEQQGRVLAQFILEDIEEQGLTGTARMRALSNAHDKLSRIASGD